MNEIQDLVNAGKLQEAILMAKIHAINHLQAAALINSKIDINESVRLAKLCTEIEPFAKSYGNLSYFLGYQGKLEDALIAINKAITISDELEYQYSRGVILSGLQRIDEAIQCYEDIIQKKPDYYNALFNLGCMLYMKGRYQEGMKLLETRFLYDSDIAKFRKRFKKPVWDGSPNKRLLIYNEQGVGDVIQYMRYVKGVNCFLIAEMQEELVPLLEPYFDIIVGRSSDYNFVSTTPDFPDHDCVISFSSLPLLLDPDLKHIPITPYIKPVGECDIKLSDKFNIGLCWAGSSFHSNDYNRSIPVKYFTELSKIPGVQLYNLQKGGEGLKGMVKFELDDFNKTAHIINKLDLVIAVDTATAHLAGSIGGPVWMLISRANDYRWLLENDTTMWYSSMKIYRQKELGNWVEVIERVIDNVRNLL